MSDARLDFVSHTLTLSDIQHTLTRATASFEQLVAQMTESDYLFSDRDEAVRLGINVASLTASVLTAMDRSSTIAEMPMSKAWRTEFVTVTQQAFAVAREESAIELIERRIALLKHASLLLGQMRDAWGQVALAASDTLLGDTDFDQLLGEAA